HNCKANASKEPRFHAVLKALFFVNSRGGSVKVGEGCQSRDALQSGIIKIKTENGVVCYEPGFPPTHNEIGCSTSSFA
ncbi:MAG: hypothetical protein FD169_1989, partial [Bacillota bacterium]